MTLIDLQSQGIRASFDPSIGLIKSFTVHDEGQDIAPLHRAPWVDGDEGFDDDIPPHLRFLGGDFFCAPFAQEAEGSPSHGWTANSEWIIQDSSASKLQARLKRTVSGADVFKEITLLPDHPFVYQRHAFLGGTGQIPVANHANVALPNGGLLRFSPKTRWVTPDAPPESDPQLGRSNLEYPSQSNNAASFPASSGTADLTRYPWFDRSEDIAIGFESTGHHLGWSAVTRPKEGDVFLSLRDTRKLPMTILWHSNGGRDYPPWNGRHFGCLGVEEAAADHMIPSQHREGLSAPGNLTLRPNHLVSVTHAIGAIRWPSKSAIQSISIEGEDICISGEDGQERRVPFASKMLFD